MNVDLTTNAEGFPERRREPKTFPPPPAVPHHSLLRRIGWGSYGEVWLARNSMGAYRAVKIVYRSSFDDPKPFERELSGIRKFEPISRTHEGFVDVLQVGLDEAAGHFFYVMELADDHLAGPEINAETYEAKTLASEIVTRGRLPAGDCMELGFALAKAIHELHKRGLVHRDIKPANILFIEGIPKLADIGLVAAMNAELSYVGTEGFIPPEGPGTPQADIFSLGKALYEASTGNDRRYFPELPAGISTFSDAARFMELNEIILRACESAPDKRYNSAAEMQADLVVLLDGGSVKRLRHLERKWAAVKRGTLAVAACLAVAGIISYPFYRGYQEKAQARQRSIGSAVANGNHAMESGDLLGSLPYFAAALRLRHELRGDERADRLRLGSVLAQCPKLTQVWHVNGSAIDAEFSPDGRHALVTTEHNQTVIYNLEDANASRLVAESPNLEAASYSPDGSLLATAGDDSTAQIFDVSTLAPVAPFLHPDRVKSARFSPDNLRLITACNDGIARIWNIRQRTVELSLRHSTKVRFAEFSHNGRVVATASEDNTARLWDAQTGQLIASLAHPSWVRHIAFSPDDSQVVTSCEHFARVWSTNGVQRFPVLAHEDIVLNAEYSPDGRMLLSSSLDGTVKLWRSDTLLPVEVNPILRLGERVRHADFCPEGRRILIAGNEGAVAVWDLSGQSPPPARIRAVASGDGRRLMTLDGNDLRITDELTGGAFENSRKVVLPVAMMALNWNGSLATVVNGPADKKEHQATIFDTATGRGIVDGFPVREPLWATCLSDDGSKAAIIDGRTATVWDAGSGRQKVIHLSADVGSAIFDGSAKRLVTWRADANLIHAWNIETGALCFPPWEMDALIRTVRASRDGTALVASCWDQGLTRCYSQVWNLNTGQPTGPRLMHGDGVLDSCFSLDMRLIACASEDFTASIWDAQAGFHRIHTVRHHGHVRSIAFDGIGDAIVTGSDDKTARVWSDRTGDPLTPALRHLAAVTNVTFLGNGERILSETRDGAACVWTIKPDQRPVEDLWELADLLCSRSLNEDQNQNSGQDGASAQATWSRLRRLYPSDFTVAESEISRWNEFVAEESKSNGDLRAAAFHAPRAGSEAGQGKRKGLVAEKPSAGGP